MGAIRLAEINIDKEVRIDELETRLAHQDHSIEKMSDEIYRLEEKVRWLVERLELIAPPQSSNAEPDEPPPHY